MSEAFHVEEFVAEAAEHLADLEDDLLALEGASATPDPQLVDKVFRAVHSIKGGAAFMGLNTIKDLSHVMENLLSKVRDGELVPEARVTDALLKGVDLLSGMVADVERSPDVNIDEVRDLLLDLTPGCDPAAEAVPGGAARLENACPDDLGAVDSLINLGALDMAALLAEHDFVYFLRYDLAREGVSAMQVASDLSNAGTVIAAEMAPPACDLRLALPQGPLRLDVVLGTLVGPDYIELVSGLPADDIVPLGELKVDGDLLDAAPAVPAMAPAPAATPAAAHQETPAPAERLGSVRISVDILDKLMTLAGELVLVRNQQLMSMDRSDPGGRDIIQRLDVVTTEIQETVMRTRMQPIGNAFSKLPRIVRDLCNKLGKRIELDMIGNEVELDKTILESLYDPLTHIIRNSCDHGIETPAEREAEGKPTMGRITVRAFHEGGQINIEFRDDGRGIDVAGVRAKALERDLRTESELAQMSHKELANLIMLPGFSTAMEVSDVSGRGVGMDVVKHALEDLGGSLELESWPGQGTSLLLRLPLTLAIIPCLIVVVGGQRYAVPQVNLDELVTLYDRDVYTRVEVAGNQEVYRLRDKLLPMVRLGEVLARPEPFTSQVKGSISESWREWGEEWVRKEANITASGEEVPMDLAGTLHFAVVKVGGDRFGLIVDQVLGTEEIVVKSMHASLKPLKIYSGGTVMGDGAVALILDIEGIARHARVFLGEQPEELREEPVREAPRTDMQSILLFRSGDKEQYAMSLPLIRRIEKIAASSMESVGDKEFITVDGVSTRVIRLDRFLSVGPAREREDMFLILPKFCKRPFGLLMTEIIDIEQAQVRLNTESYVQDGLLGTDIIRGHLTLFPDLYRLVELAEPGWFAGRRRLPPSRASRMRILLAEDSSFMREMIRAYLEADGYQVTGAENGQHALSLLEKGDFDLLVSDIRMPLMDGVELIREMRLSGGRLKDLPAVALTSLDAEEDRKAALDAGYDEYLVKIDRERFLDVVAAMLAERGTQEAGHAV